MGWTFYNSNGEALVQHAESEATQAEMEAETAGVKFVPPDLVKNSPGVAKVWCQWEQSGAHSRTSSYNMTSTTDSTVAGGTDHLWATDFSGTAYVIVGMAEEAKTITTSGGLAATGVTTMTINTSDGVRTDATNNFLAAFGDQA